MINIILTMASIIVALTTIVTATKTVYKLARNIEKFSETQNEIQLSVLRLTVINEGMPLDERVDAGEKYVSKGGNGSVHALYDVLREEYEEKLKKK